MPSFGFVTVSHTAMPLGESNEDVMKITLQMTLTICQNLLFSQNLLCLSHLIPQCMNS